MSALTIQLPSTPVDFSQLVGLDEAAKRLASSVGNLRRKCEARLADAGMALKLTPPEGGQERWFIRRDYDRRLIAGDLGGLYVEPDLAEFSGKQREGALKRRACVVEFRQARQTWPGLMRDWLPRLCDQLSKRFGMRVGKTQLQEWEKKYQRPADLAKLVDTRGGNHRGADDPDAWRMFRDLYLHANQPSIKQCWEEVKKWAPEHGWKWCSLDSCHKQLNKRIPPEQQTRHREPAKWRQQLRPFIAQDPEAWAAGECWIGDHKQLDIWCRAGKTLVRPWLTTWMDWRTRKICGWVLSEAPNSSTILGALAHGLDDESNFGGPAAVWIDNGKDYDCWMFHGQTKKQRLSRRHMKPAMDEAAGFSIFSALQIEAHFSLPFNPNGKSRLERWFRTLETFFKTFSTYAGQDVESRPEELNKILATGRGIPNFDDVLFRMADVIAGYNANADHTREDCSEDGQKLSPGEAMQRWCKTRRLLADPQVRQSLLQVWHPPVTVGRNGISLRINGRTFHYGQFEAALTPFKALSKKDRRPVICSYVPNAIQTIRVHDEQLKLICICDMNQLGGMHGRDDLSRQHVGEMIRQRASYEKAQKIVASHEITQVLTSAEQLAQIAAAEAKERAPRIAVADQPAMRIVQTPLDGQEKRNQGAVARKAVGDGTPTQSSLSLMDRLKRLGRPSPAAPARTADPWARLRQMREADDDR